MIVGDQLFNIVVFQPVVRILRSIYHLLLEKQSQEDEMDLEPENTIHPKMIKSPSDPTPETIHLRHDFELIMETQINMAWMDFQMLSMFTSLGRFFLFPAFAGFPQQILACKISTTFWLVNHW